MSSESTISAFAWHKVANDAAERAMRNIENYAEITCNPTHWDSVMSLVITEIK